MAQTPLHLLVAAAAFLSLGAATAPKVPARAATAALELPTNTEQRYLWLKGRQKVGETILRFQQVPHKGEQAYVLDAVRRYDHEGISQRSRGTTIVNRLGLPLRFEESANLSTVQGARTSQKTEIDFNGETAHVTTQHNGQGSRVERDIATPKQPTYLYANQALEHWVVFTAMFPLAVEEHTIRLLYPDFNRVLEVTFRIDEKESLAIGNEKIAAQRYSFKSSKGDLKGLVWLDKKGRLLQLEFPGASLRLVLAPDA